MSKSFLAVRLLALAAFCCTAYGRERTQSQPTEKLIGGCPCDAPLSEPELRKMTEAAQRGEVSATAKLWDYYVWRGEDDKAAPWEERLVRAGYPMAIGHRSDMLFSAAYHLKDTDPQKLSLLNQSIYLEARYRKAVAGKVVQMTVNGKSEDVRFSGEPDEGTRNRQKLLARVEAAQRKLR